MSRNIVITVGGLSAAVGRAAGSASVFNVYFNFDPIYGQGVQGREGLLYSVLGSTIRVRSLMSHGDGTGSMAVMLENGATFDLLHEKLMDYMGVLVWD